MEALKRYIAPCINVFEISTEYMMMAGSGPDTETTDPKGDNVSGGPETGTGTGGGPGAKPYTPWENDGEW